MSSCKQSALLLVELQAIRAGLKALQGLGVWGVVVNVWWSQVEPSPRQYDWAQYQAVFDAAREVGLKVKVRGSSCISCRRGVLHTQRYTGSMLLSSGHRKAGMQGNISQGIKFG